MAMCGAVVYQLSVQIHNARTVRSNPACFPIKTPSVRRATENNIIKHNFFRKLGTQPVASILLRIQRAK